jgi:hypothetical protein
VFGKRIRCSDCENSHLKNSHEVRGEDLGGRAPGKTANEVVLAPRHRYRETGRQRAGVHSSSVLGGPCHLLRSPRIAIQDSTRRSIQRGFFRGGHGVTCGSRRLCQGFDAYNFRPQPAFHRKTHHGLCRRVTSKLAFVPSFWPQSQICGTKRAHVKFFFVSARSHRI